YFYFSFCFFDVAGFFILKDDSRIISSVSNSVTLGVSSLIAWSKNLIIFSAELLPIATAGWVTVERPGSTIEATGSSLNPIIAKSFGIFMPLFFAHMIAL